MPLLAPPVILSPVTDPSEYSAWTAAGYGDLSANGASATWPANNRAFYIPLYVEFPFLVQKLLLRNGATANANIDIGIYNRIATRLVHIGSTAQAGVSAIQEFDIADTLVMPDMYYLGVVLSATTGTAWRNFMGSTIGPLLLRAMGVRQESLGSTDLPATATFSAMASDYLPFVAMTGRLLV